MERRSRWLAVGGTAVALGIAALFVVPHPGAAEAKGAQAAPPAPWALSPAVPPPAALPVLTQPSASAMDSPGLLPWGIAQINQQTANVIHGEQEMVQLLTAALRREIEQLLPRESGR